MFIQTRKFSVNESIIAYYGRHDTKQFIRGKAVRFGITLWWLCSSDGYFIHAEPYCGSDINIEETGSGQGPGVVLALIDKCKLPKQSTVTFDNLFTSLPLLNKLSDDSIYELGTIREN